MAAVDLDEYVHLTKGGVWPPLAARRLGVTLSGVEKAARRQGRDDLAREITAVISHERRQSGYWPAQTQRRNAA